MIICGHGHYATGFKSTMELLAGKNEDIFYVDFTEADTDGTLKEKLLSVVNENINEEILFVCDILGGTPFRVAAEIASSSKNMELVAGCNIGGILEASFLKDSMPLGQLADEIVEKSKSSIIRFSINEESNDGLFPDDEGI